MNQQLSDLGITLDGKWPDAHLANLREAVFTHIGANRLARWMNGQALTFRFGGHGALSPGTYYGLTRGDTVTLFSNRNVNPVINILHEIGHAVDNLWHDHFTNALERTVFRLDGTYFAGWNGYQYRRLPPEVIRREALIAPRAGGGDAWQQRGGIPYWEDWADIFSNAMIGNISPGSEIGSQLAGFVGSMQAHVCRTSVA